VRPTRGAAGRFELLNPLECGLYHPCRIHSSRSREDRTRSRVFPIEPAIIGNISHMHPIIIEDVPSMVQAGGRYE